MIDKSDIKYIIRRIIVFLIMSIIFFVCGSCNAKALTTTANINYYENQQPHGQSTGSYTQTTSIYQDGYLPPNVPTHEPFKGLGEGYVIFSITYRMINQPTNVVLAVDVSNDEQVFTCDIGTNMVYFDNTSGNTIMTAKCPVNYTTNHGLKYITITRNGATGSIAWSVSKYATFVSKDNVNVQVNQAEVVSAVQSSQTAMIQALEASGAIAHADAQAAIQATNNAASQAHQDAQQAHSDSQAINNSLNDESAPTNNDISGNTSQWSNMNASNNTITQLLTMPLTLINAYLNGINGTCSSFNLGSLYGTDLVLPCINIATYIGSALWSTIDVLFSGFMIFNIGRKLIKIFNDFTNLNSNQVDELYGGGA